MIELAGALGLGLALGVVTGMPLGVVNVAVAEAAAAGRVRFAVALGGGGAIADAIHAAIAFAGIGRLVTERPEWTRAMAVIAAVAVLGYVAATWRRRGASDRPARVAPRALPGVLAGMLLTLPNPGALGAWVAVAAATWPAISLAGALVLAAGVGAGSALWFALLARWVSRAPRLGRAIARIGLVLLVAIAGFGLGRAFS